MVSPRDQNALDVKTVFHAEEDFDRSVRGSLGGGDFESADPGDVLHFLPEILREVRHLLKGSRPLLVEPFENLFRPVLFLAVFRDQLLDFLERHIF